MVANPATENQIKVPCKVSVSVECKNEKSQFEKEGSIHSNGELSIKGKP